MRRRDAAPVRDVSEPGREGQLGALGTVGHRTPSPVAAPIVDIVVPVYNEVVALPAGVRRLHEYLERSFPFSWRVTIVDNASTDGTWFVAGQLAREFERVRAVHLDQKGRGRALRSAWSTSDAAIVAYMDVDLSTDLDALLPLVASLVSGHSDIAIGSRLAPGASVARFPKREFISRAYNFLLRAVFATPVRDAQCGFKAVRADVARRLLPEIEDDGWFFDTELLLLARRNGLRIHEVPVDWVDDADSRVDVVGTAAVTSRASRGMVRRFWSGGGRVELGDAARPALEDDFGRRLVVFSAIGCVSTCVSLALFLLLHGALGSVWANAVAVTATFVANTWANARFTARRSGARWPSALALYVGTLALTTCALLVVAALGGGIGADIAVLVATWSIGSFAAPRARVVLVAMIGRVVRCFAVSVGTTLLSAVVLVALAVGLGVPAGIANVVAVGCGIGPSYVGNRRWVWKLTDRSSYRREIIPFWTLAIAGLITSTMVVAWIGTETASWTPAASFARVADRQSRDVRGAVGRAVRRARSRDLR